MLTRRAPAEAETICDHALAMGYNEDDSTDLKVAGVEGVGPLP